MTKALAHRVPAVTEGLAPSAAAGLLARTALSLASRRMGGREPSPYLKREEALRARIVDEIRGRLSIGGDDDSSEALQAIEEAIDCEIERISDPIDYEAALSRIATARNPR